MADVKDAKVPENNAGQNLPTPADAPIKRDDTPDTSGNLKVPGITTPETDPERWPGASWDDGEPVGGWIVTPAGDRVPRSEYRDV